MLTRVDTNSYCMIVVYPSTTAGTDLGASFAAEWTSVALQTIDAVPVPTPAFTTLGDARAAVGTATSKAQGQPVMCTLIVLDAGASVLSMLLLSSSIEAFKAYDADNTTYVDRDTGAYAGTDSIHFTEKWVITAAGTIALDFFGIQNGKKIVEKSTGTVTLSAAGILAIRMTNEQRYVLRGWLTGPNVTVMKVNGPWYDHIPADILTNREQGTNLDKNWVRLVRS